MRIISIALLSAALALPSLALASAAVSPPLLRAIEQQDWTKARNEVPRSSPFASYIEWNYLLDNETIADFYSLSRFIKAHEDWPRMKALRLRAEKALFQERPESAVASSWLARFPALSGYGMLALARADDTSASSSKHAQTIRNAWINGDFERADEQNIRNEFGNFLNEKTHENRAERLLFDGKASIAESLLGDVSAPFARLMKARIGLQRDEGNVEGLLAAVPSSLAKHHGLIADRTLWRDRKGLDAGVRELLEVMHRDSPYAEAVWKLRASIVRDAIEARDLATAQKLLANAGSKLESASQADALWLDGWLHYRFLKNPNRAYEQFNKLYHAVQFPVSKSRGAYWAGRAAEKNGNQDIAKGWFERAAEHTTTFYGQLAFAKRYPKRPLKLAAAPSPDSSALSRYREHALWLVATQFYASDAAKLAAPLVSGLAESASSKGEYAALMSLAKEAQLHNAQVLIAKMALRKHIALQEGWPLVKPSSDSPLPPELALAISRQESEFNPRAVSSADARGLMQLLPSTASKVAANIGVPYSLNKLFDPVYNMRLGSQYLANLISGFGGNNILAISGYNAGPGRSRQWVDRFGHPGADLDSTLTFLELIPFSETRNYVQRVLENAQVYRAILYPDSPLLIERDLLR